MPYKAGEVTVIEPRSFSESAQIVKKLIEKKTVVLHLDLLDKEQSQRTIDFVCGASHALNGSVQKISDAVVIFTPDTIALSVENAQMQSKFAESLWNKPL
jgi:cell division inhibitor SepF